MSDIEWLNASDRRDQYASMHPISYDCGYCGRSVASDYGYSGRYEYLEYTTTQRIPVQICICPNCNNPTYFGPYSHQTPQPAFGEDVEYVPWEEVRRLYDEARACMQVGAHTAAAMCCRKLLMNVAVAEGAEPNLAFWKYVQYLYEEGHVTKKAKKWVDHIRNKGNDANHEISIVDREDAQRLIKFSEMMLRTMYEYPAEVEDPAQS